MISICTLINGGGVLMASVVRPLHRQWAMAGRGDDSRPLNTAAQRPGNGGHEKPTILIVEDEVLVRLPVADFLRGKDFRVIEASNAEEALSVFRAGEPIELMFSDISMPGDMDGLELARWVRRHHPDVRIVLTSGRVNPHELLPGDTDVPLLDKPYSYERLAEQIRRLTLL